MERRIIEVRGQQAGKTVQRILRDDGGFSHAFARGLIAAGCVKRNSRTVDRPDERVKPGDRIELRYDPGTRYRAPRVTRPGTGYRIVHEDKEVVVAEKPAGLLTLPTPSGHGDSLLEELIEAYRALIRTLARSGRMEEARTYAKEWVARRAGRARLVPPE